MQKIFLDNWAIAGLSSYPKLVEALSPGGERVFVPVVSMWNLFEIAQDGHEKRAYGKAGFLDKLQPLWMKLPHQLMQGELAPELYKHISVSFSDSFNPFNKNLRDHFTEAMGGSYRCTTSTTSHPRRGSRGRRYDRGSPCWASGILPCCREPCGR